MKQTFLPVQSCQGKMLPLFYISVLCFLPLTCQESSKCKVINDPKYTGVLMDCASQGLTQLPSPFPEGITTLLFKENKLNHLQNLSFSTAKMLVILDLSINLIFRMEENAFGGLDKLMSLYLQGNCLILSPETYHKSVFIPLTALISLNLSHNSIVNTVQRPSSSCNASMKGMFAVLPSLYSVPKVLNGTISLSVHSQNRRPVSQAVNKTQVNTAQKVYNDEMKILQTNIGISRVFTEEFYLDYPDDALASLVNLETLHLDGLTNKSFGPGFKQLRNLTHLSLNGHNGNCYLDTVTAEMFVNVPHVEVLNLKKCRIKVLSADAFSTLENLTSLDLSFNYHLGLKSLVKAFDSLSRTKLENLSIDGIVHPRTPTITLRTMDLGNFTKLTNLKRLQAGFNKIEAFDNGLLCSLVPDSLTSVSLNGNPLILLSYINDIKCLRNLKYLSINGYTSEHTPPLKVPNGELVKNNGFHSVYSQDVETKKINEFVLPPKLKYLLANNFGLFYKLQYIPVHPDNSLTHIYAAGNHFPVWQGNVTNLKHLTHLYLQDCFCREIHADFFDSFPNLEVLDISGNRLRGVFNADKKGRILHGLKNLKSLAMARMDINNFPEAIFHQMDKLESLTLSVNGMASFTPDISHMKNLSFINLSKNLLNFLPGHVRKHLDTVAQTHNVTLDMTFNPIVCICENIDFLIWIKDSEVNLGNHSNYFCEVKGVTTQMDDIIVTISRLDKECRNYVGVFVAASASCLAVTVILGIAIAYRYRWKLRYLYYASILNFHRQRCEDNDEYEYDAFVSFTSEDKSFVMGDLQPRLEDGLGLKLCIHTRELNIFTPGKYISSGVVDAVQRSRHTLVVLTRSLLKSDWCNYELQMSLMEGSHMGRDVLVFLLYEDIPSHELPRDILFNIQSHTYIEYPHSETDRDLFWNRLAHALRI